MAPHPALATGKARLLALKNCDYGQNSFSVNGTFENFELQAGFGAVIIDG